MQSFKQFLIELRKDKKYVPSSGNEIIGIEKSEKPVTPKDKDADYVTHHVVWTHNGKGYMVHKKHLHHAFGGTNSIGLKIGDDLNPADHNLFYDPEHDKE